MVSPSTFIKNMSTDAPLNIERMECVNWLYLKDHIVEGSRFKSFLTLSILSTAKRPVAPGSPQIKNITSWDKYAKLKNAPMAPKHKIIGIMNFGFLFSMVAPSGNNNNGTITSM